MGRSIGLVLLLVSLGIGGYVFLAQSRTVAPTSTVVTRAETRGNAFAAATNFQGADAALQAWFAENATYAGATLPPGAGAVLVRADASTYCLQSGTGAAAEHEVGPGG